MQNIQRFQWQLLEIAKGVVVWQHVLLSAGSLEVEGKALRDIIYILAILPKNRKRTYLEIASIMRATNHYDKLKYQYLDDSKQVVTYV